MHLLCRWIVRLFALAYLVALALLVIGTFGLFGQERDPLSGVFLVPLGLPWNRWVDMLPQGLPMWGMILAPVLNLIILRALCRAVAGGRR
ncbi:MAG: hypothetical protein H6898_07605 [Rhodobacter sp.]|nr:hypothetical protein [Paracoccaceae bacterium]MCC0076439.1 hypothetical protein [Rhodobacter sp.]